MEKWYTRTVFSVTDPKASLTFYCDELGFRQDWVYEENGAIVVAQVSRGDCEIILAGNLDRAGQGRIYVSLEEAEMTLLLSQASKMDTPPRKINWGYPTFVITDTDGNELFFPEES